MRAFTEVKGHEQIQVWPPGQRIRGNAPVGADFESSLRS